MFGLGTSELLIILAIVVLVFGASRLPKLGRGLGEGLRGFKEAMRGEDERSELAEKEHGAEGSERNGAV